MQVAEGVLEPTIRSGEERAIVYELSKRAPFTLLVDGLDETHTPDRVRRALTFWLNSVLGEHGIAIVSSRQRFWALCSDDVWEAWIPTETGRSETVADELLSHRAAGLRLPEPFDDGELRDAWVRAGREPSELAALGRDVRAELRHPFTLRAFLELSADVGPLTETTRTSVLERWIARRLRAEEEPETFLTADIYRTALGIVAERISKSPSSVSVDDLEGVPRFDRQSPPGPVISRLLDAGLLEVLSERPNHIRFAYEAVADFCQGHMDARRAVADPLGIVRNVLMSPLSSTAQRLENLGKHLRHVESQRRLVIELARFDPARALIMMRTVPDRYDSDLRATVSNAVAQDITAPLHAKAAFAADLLGHFNCAEARDALERHLPSADACPKHLRIIGALAVGRASVVGAAPLAYANPLFQSHLDPYYFANVVHIFRSATSDFKQVLLDLAAADLQKSSGTAQHSQAVSVLAHVGNNLLVRHLESRLQQAGLLEGYENHALLAVGTDSAARLFELSASATAAKMATLGWSDGGTARAELFHRICPMTPDLRHLISPPFEELLEMWLRSILGETAPVSDELGHMAVTLAQVSRSRNLARLFALASAKIGGPGWHELDYDWIDPIEWVRWWNDADTDGVKDALAKALPSTPTPALEDVLIDCLEDERLAAYAARYLGRVGSWTARRQLRQVAAAGGQDQRRWSQSEAITALAGC